MTVIDEFRGKLRDEVEAAREHVRTIPRSLSRHSSRTPPVTSVPCNTLNQEHGDRR